MTETEADQAVRDLAGTVIARRTQAKVVRRIAVTLGGWTPDPKHCHGNVARWVATNPDHVAVPGWQIIDAPSLGLPYVDVIAHSVVEDGNGDLVDITPVAPLLTLLQIPFLRHWGTVAEFEGLKSSHQLGIIRVYSAGGGFTVLSA
jgi:hypothetical protein